MVVACSAILPAQTAAPDARDIIRRAAQHDRDSEKKARDYTYVQRMETRKLDGQGRVKSVESTTSQILVLYGEHVKQVLARNDKPLSDKDRQKEEDKLNKLVRERQNESPEQRAKRAAKQEKEREDERAFVEEVAAAYDFRFLPDEVIDGRAVWAIAAEPRRDYRPQRKQARILPKFHFTVWVDKAEYAWVKLDAEAIDTISFGLFLARINRGTRIRIEQTRVNDEIWLPRHVSATLDARIALLKKYNLELDATYRDYKKFRVDSKVTVPDVERP